MWDGLPWQTMQNRHHSQQCPEFHNIHWLMKCHRLIRSASLLFQKVTIVPIMTDSVFQKIFLITCTGFRLSSRQQTAVLTLNIRNLPHRRYSFAKHHVSQVHMIGNVSYGNIQLNLSNKITSRTEKLTLNQPADYFLKNYTESQK